MSVSPIPSRLDFVASARREFKFLSDRPYAFWLVSQDEEVIAYESDGIELSVYHDRLSYELDVALARLSHEDEVLHPYGVSDLVRLSDPASMADYRTFAATTSEGVNRGVARLANELRAHGPLLLDPSSQQWDQLSQARARASNEFGKTLAAKTLREQATRAWSRRNYAAVLEAYSQLSDRLSEIEQRRLQYATKKLGL